jgi:diadenosine tetraphosphate (Ap4A) HIT family hydrolase
MDADCPFCGVLAEDKNKQIISIGQHFTAIRKLYTSKNVNFLVISNKHVENLKNGNVYMNDLVRFVNELSKGKDWSMKISNGKIAGQDIFHLHAHISSYQRPESWGI